MSQLLQLPWEHAHSAVSFKPHATARLHAGGKARNFLLRMQNELVFFKEPSRAPIFVVTERFDPALARDSIGLISAWQRQVANLNFGVLVSKRDYFPRLPVRAHLLTILKGDGSGWMREHFDSDWFLLPDDHAAPLDVWNEREVGAHLKTRLSSVQTRLISRAVEPHVVESDAPRWLDLEGEQIAQLVRAAACLFVAPSQFWNEPEQRLLKIKSHSAFARGDIEGAWLKHALHQPRFGAFWELLEPRIRFVGVRWSEGGEDANSYGRTRSEKIFEAGLEKWGRFWRGNWAPQRARFAVALPDTQNHSAHEKMEAALVLRAWLRDQMSERDIESLLQMP